MLRRGGRDQVLQAAAGELTSGAQCSTSPASWLPHSLEPRHCRVGGEVPGAAAHSCLQAFSPKSRLRGSTFTQPEGRPCTARSGEAPAQGAQGGGRAVPSLSLLSPPLLLTPALLSLFVSSSPHSTPYPRESGQL